MNIQLISGSFTPTDAVDIISQMMAIKIKFHEEKIAQSEQEEDIKFRESKIKKLQKELFELKSQIDWGSKSVSVDAVLNIG